MWQNVSWLVGAGQAVLWHKHSAELLKLSTELWFFLKLSKARSSISKARLSVSKARPRVLKQMLGRVFWSTYTLGIFGNLVRKKQPSYISPKPRTRSKAWYFFYQFSYLPFSLNLFHISLPFFAFSDIDH